MKPIPQAFYPCRYCYEHCSWPANDLYWSEIDQDWVCDICWDDRDSVWDGDNYTEEEKKISLADEMERVKRPGLE